MVIYIITFFATILLTYLVQKKEENKLIKIVCIILIIFIPSFIGGMRNLTIGTDISIYAERVFLNAVYAKDFVSYQNIVQTNIGYALLNYIVARFSSSVNIFLFVVQLITNSLVFSAIYYNRKKIPMWISMAIFLTVFYGRTYNYIRQSISLSIIIFSTRYIEKNELKKFIMCVVIATMFHATAVFAISLYVLNFITKRKNRIIYEIVVILCAIVFTLAINNALKILYELGIITQRYYDYTTVYVNDTGSFSKVDVLYKLIWIVLYSAFRKKLRKEDNINEMYGMCLYMDFIFFFIGKQLEYADRICLYFGYTTILFIPKMIEGTVAKKDKNIIYCLTIIVLAIYWYITFVIDGNCEIYPYASSILGIK